MKVAVFMGGHSLAFLLLTAAPMYAQAPSADWKTLTSAHFRFHYPAPYEAWTMRAASRIESVRDAVVREVGYAPEAITDVVVMNPVADPNGITIPLLRSPRIVLYTEPPDPETEIGEFTEWIDLLTVHEMTHLIHLMRPSRSPLQHTIERILPLNPITLDAPRWVLEGYATVIEGRITGSGRPSGSMRAALLRKLAISGRLPTYSQLDSSRQFLGSSMAYFAGSAFLEWLEQTRGPDSLRNLWARMTARQRRSFGGAFEGVFGEPPERLYGRFAAELTQRAVDLQRSIELREGELWQETKRGSGDPAVSPDGSQLVMVDRGEKGEVKLVVFSTGPNEEEKKLQERIEKILKRDPQDVAPIRTRPVPRKPAHTLKLPDRGDISNPRWTRDGSAIVFTHRQCDRDGFLHNDLFLWQPASGYVRRITHLADVKDADPLPDRKRAIGVRNRFGYSQLVTVDLTSGAVEPYSEARLDRVYTHPRAAADGRIAWAEHDASGWRIAVDGQSRQDGAFAPEWGAGGALFGVRAANGFIDLTGDGAPLTRSGGIAMQAAPAPDGSVYFMSLEPDGLVVRHLGAVEPLAKIDVAAAAFVPALPPQRATPVVFRSESLAPARPYGIRRPERAIVAGGLWSAHDRSFEAGVRLGDVVGRLDTLAIGATGADRGLALISTWRGWPVALTAHAFHLPDESGVELRGEYRYRAPLYDVAVEAGAASPSFARATLALRQRDTDGTIQIAADSDRRVRGVIEGRARFGMGAFVLRGEMGRRLTIGGFASSVVPDSLRIGRVDDPALPLEFAFAERYRAARAELHLSSLTLFWQRYDLAGNIDVRGLEVRAFAPPMPLIGTPAVEVTAGVARVTYQRGVKGWLALRWRP